MSCDKSLLDPLQKVFSGQMGGHKLRKITMATKTIFIGSVIMAALLALSFSVLGVEPAVDKALEEAAEKAAEKAVEKVTEKTIEKAIEKAVDEATGKPVVQVQKDRPEQRRGPTKVEFFIFVIDIDKIDGSDQNFYANFHLTLRWKDERLAEDTDFIRRISLEEIWSPGVLLINQDGTVWESLPKVASVAPDGTVTYRQRYVGPLSQPLMLYNFPMDKHRFTIQLATTEHEEEDIEFMPLVTLGFSGGAISDKLSLTDWEIVSFEAGPNPYIPVANVIVPGFAFEFTAKRHFLYFLWQVILPMALIVTMSLAVLWIDRSNASAKIGLATSAMLALITFRFILARLLPKLPYMTRMDYFTFVSTMLVFLTLIQVIATQALSRGNQDRLGHNLGKYARIVFPISFLLIFGWFMLGLFVQL